VIARAERVLLPDGVLEDGVVERDGDLVLDVRRARVGDPPQEAEWIVPGTVNAHVHLELSWAAGRVPGGAGLAEWVIRLREETVPAAGAVEAAVRRAAEEMAEAGSVLACDVSNSGATANALAAAGLSGIVQHEVLGLGRERTHALRAADAPLSFVAGGIAVRPSPHATYSTAPDVLVAAASPRGGVPATIHVAEDPDEERFLMEGAGSFATLLDRFGVDWRWFLPPRVSPARWLDELGVLGPALLVVHGVHLSAEDRQRLAARGSPLCLCPRSNLHIGGALPDVPALLAAGVKLCVGTDSLASSPTLDVIDDVRVLREAFPEIEDERWLRMATEGGAHALGRGDLGRLKAGARCGAVAVTWEGTG
jgi:cytosine/adenosine deaminase-related metal-dependent hydrolase